jgi:hypothetical protein
VARRVGVSDAEIRELFASRRTRGRDDRWQLPSARMIILGRRFAAAEPGLVSIHIDDEESQLREAGNQPGERYLHRLLIEKGPAYVLVREWVGANHIAGALRADNDRLRSLLRQAASLLRARGHEREARKFHRARGRLSNEHARFPEIQTRGLLRPLAG